MRVTRILAAALLVFAVAGCGQGRQDEDEPEGSYRVDVVDASFPAKQSIAERSTMKIRVRNPDSKTVPNVAVTVETKGAAAGAGLVAFGQSQADSRLADPNRPVWVLDREPEGGTSAYSNSWTLGPLGSGQAKTFEWHVTAVEPGDYTIDYRVAPGLDGKAKLAEGSRASGRFKVTISDKPVPARVDANGNVVRGEEAGGGGE